MGGLKSKYIHKRDLHAEFESSSSNIVDLHCTPILIFSHVFVAGQRDLRSNERSNSNFDCKNGFLGVDYKGLDTLHEKIGHFTEKSGGVSPLSIGGV